jgi:protein involved in polysaccharide export with SLBB domain
MLTVLTNLTPDAPGRRPWRLPALLALVVCGLLSGCAAVSNPVAEAIPVRHIPRELLGRPREELKTIPMTLIRQPAPKEHIIGPGDVLGIYIEGVLGDRNQIPPVRLVEVGNQPPALGYPVPVRDDGTLSLPYIEALKVEGMTITEAQAALVKAYTVTRQILVAGRERISVSLMKPRSFHILVVRQDSGGQGIGAPTLIGQTKRGTGVVLDLPIYENDVLNALARSGGLPGLDAKNEVIIERGTYKGQEGDGKSIHLPACAGGASSGSASEDFDLEGTQRIRIPLRMRPGDTPPFSPNDIVLKNGDIIFIEARDTELFYTGGLLPTGQFPIPRDFDLDVIKAIALVQGPLVNGGFNTNNLSGTLLNTANGVGFASPSQLTVLRRTKNGGQLPIRVSLNRALRDPRERILVQPGDILILQETLDETMARYFTTVLRSVTLGTYVRQRDLVGTATLSLP